MHAYFRPGEILIVFDWHQLENINKSMIQEHCVINQSNIDNRVVIGYRTTVEVSLHFQHKIAPNIPFPTADWYLILTFNSFVNEQKQKLLMGETAG